jgi:drug/metabolite transporter (DMT)-like permease
VSRAVSPRLAGFAWLVLTALGWGINWPVLKASLAEWPPFGFRTLSSFGGMVVLLVLARLRGEPIWPRGGREWFRLTVSGVLNITSFVGLGTLALLWLDASEATIVAYTMPIWAAMFAWPVLGERPTSGRLAGLVVGLGGVAILILPLAAAAGGELRDKLPGFACILGTAVMFAFGTVLSKRMPPRSPPLTSLAWQIAIGSLPIALGALTLDHWQGVHIGPVGWLGLAYVAVVALAIAYFAWFRALALLPAASAAVGTLMVPVIGVAFAGVLLGEPLGWRQLLALAMTLSGVVLALRR